MKPKIVKTVYFPTWIACRNYSVDGFGTQFDRIGCREGFAMIHRVTGQVTLLIVQT